MGIHSISFWVGAPLTVFILVFIMNAINLIDGIDGLSASLSFIALGGFFYCFLIEGMWIYCILIAGLMGVLVPFLYYNIFGKLEKNRKYSWATQFAHFRLYTWRIACKVLYG